MIDLIVLNLNDDHLYLKICSLFSQCTDVRVVYVYICIHISHIRMYEKTAFQHGIRQLCFSVEIVV